MPFVTLHEILVAALDGDPGARACARSLLSTPWCRPIDSEQVALAARLAPPPAVRSPGHALLVAVDREDKSGALWEHLPLPADDRRFSFQDAAAGAHAIAKPLAARELPILPSVEEIRKDPVASASPIHPSVRDAAPGGASFGLAMLLAAASELVALPIPDDVCATGRIAANGEIGRVAGVARKARMLRDFAPRVRRFIVPAEDAAEARDAGLEVIGVSTAREALEHVFPFATIEARLVERWSDPRTAARVTDELFDLALRGQARIHVGSRRVQAIVRWRPIAEAATRLESFAPSESVARRAQIARQIAARHDGEATTMGWPSWLEEEFKTRLVQLEVLAHVVQSVTDGHADDETVRDRAERARAYLRAPAERSEGDLKLLGATARAWAILRDYERAARDALEAVEQWFEQRKPAEASHALCEAIRVVGIVGDADRLSALIEGPVARLRAAHDTSTLSLAFVQLAIGRALCTLGEHARACSALEGAIDWNTMPDHLQSSRARWYARALEALDRIAEAAAARALAKDEFALLVALDHARARDDAAAIAAALEGLARSPVPRVRRLVRQASASPDPARIIADEYSY